MPLHIALLRGINVGGSKLVRMADLRALLSDLGLTEPRSLLNSGNLVFGCERRSAAALERLLEAETARRLGLTTAFFVRTAAEWGHIIDANPFPAEAREDPAHLLVGCLRQPPRPEDVRALQAAIPGREKIAAVGRQLYLVYPDGIGRSRLTGTLIDKTLKTSGTARNWNTVLKLADIVKA